MLAWFIVNVSLPELFSIGDKRWSDILRVIVHFRSYQKSRESDALELKSFVQQLGVYEEDGFRKILSRSVFFFPWSTLGDVGRRDAWTQTSYGRCESLTKRGSRTWSETAFENSILIVKFVRAVTNWTNASRISIQELFCWRNEVLLVASKEGKKEGRVEILYILGVYIVRRRYWNEKIVESH